MLNMLLIKIMPFSALKILFLKLLGAKIGVGVKIGFSSTIRAKNYSNIIIGNYVEIGRNVNIKVADLDIGNFSIIGNNVEILGDGKFTLGQSSFISNMHIDTLGGIQIGDFFACSYGNISSHDFSETWFNPGKKYKKFNLVVGNNVWMGARASSLNGNIGSESLIAGGSVVLSDLPNNSFAIGNPAKVIKKNELKEIDLNLITKRDFQENINNKCKKYKIFFTNKLVSKKDFENFQSDVVICNYLEPEFVSLFKKPVISLKDRKVYNMKSYLIGVVRELRAWGIFLKD